MWNICVGGADSPCALRIDSLGYCAAVWSSSGYGDQGFARREVDPRLAPWCRDCSKATCRWAACAKPAQTSNTNGFAPSISSAKQPVQDSMASPSEHQQHNRGPYTGCGCLWTLNCRPLCTLGCTEDHRIVPVLQRPRLQGCKAEVQAGRACTTCRYRCFG